MLEREEMELSIAKLASIFTDSKSTAFEQAYAMGAIHALNWTSGTGFNVAEMVLALKREHQTN